MKTKLFSKKLYIEALRQLRLPGGAAFAVVFLISILQPISYILNDYDTYMYDNWRQVIGAAQVAPLVTVFMFLAPVLFTILLFYFLNKRNASDFYHSLPHTRISHFLSFIAAILTVIYVTIIITVISCGLLFMVADVQFSGVSMIYIILTTMAGATLITAATAIGMCLTGTLISNLSVMMLALFLPRVVLVAITLITTEITQIISQVNMGIFGNVAYNIPSNFIMGPFVNHRYSLDGAYSFVGGIVFTFLLAIIYIAVGTLLFHKRKSETAEKSSPTKILQHVYRCLVTLPFTMIITGMLIADNDPTGYDSVGTIVYITLIIVCLLIYYIFEVVTTRKLSNVIKATPVLLVLIALNVVFALAVYTSKAVILSYSPEADKIEWVSFDDLVDYDYRGNGYNYYASTNEYNRLMLGDLRIEDEEVKKIIAEALENSIEMSKNREDGARDKIYVTINSKGSFTRERFVYLTSEQYYALSKVLMSDDEFLNAITDLPKEKNISNKFFQFNFHSDSFVDSKGKTNFLIEDMDELYGIFTKEYETLTTIEKTSLINSDRYYKTVYPEIYTLDKEKFVDYGVFNLIIEGNVGVHNFASNLSITPLVPKTYEYVLNEINKKCGDKAVERLEVPVEDVQDTYLFTIRSNYLFDEGELYLQEFIYGEDMREFGMNPEVLQEMFDIIIVASNRQLDLSQPVIAFIVKDSNYNLNGIKYVNLTKEEFEQIVDLQEDVYTEKN